MECEKFCTYNLKTQTQFLKTQECTVVPVKPIVLNERDKQKMVKKPLSDNANVFCRLTTFMVGKKLEIKVTLSLNRVKDFLLENHGSNLVEQIQYCAKRF